MYQSKLKNIRAIFSGFLPYILLITIITGCNTSTSKSEKPETLTTKTESNNGSQLKIVTTFLPMYWFTKAITRDTAQVEILVNPGTEIHEYQATPSNLQIISQADVLVKNGLGLEEFLEDTVKNSQNSKLKEINASAGIKPLQDISPRLEPVKSTDKKDSEHDHKSGNPHVWLDPVLVKQQIINIRDGLIKADSKNKDIYNANAAKYIQQLEELDQQFKQQLSKYPNCSFITFHDAYPYLAKRYKLNQVAIVKIPEDSLSPGEVQKTVETVKQFQVKTLLGEPGVDNKLLQSLAQDLKLTVYSLDSLESGSMQPDYYFTAMRKNLQTLENACR